MSRYLAHFSKLILVAFIAMLVVGCNNSASTSDSGAKQDSNSAKASADNKATSPTPKPAPSQKGDMKMPSSKEIVFQDNLEANVDLPQSIGELEFTSIDKDKIKLADYFGKKSVILVFTEGFNGMLCPFCTTQTSRLIANYEEFKKRNCEVIVVYPGPTDHLEEFVKAAKKTEKDQVDDVPFPLVLDEEFTATNFFDIQSMQAHPSTYLIDSSGNVKFAYVGKNMTADRPSVKALLKRLDDLER